MNLKRFQKVLREKKIDMAIVYNWNNPDPNLFYFTGLSLDYSFLLIPKKGNSILATSKLEHERAKRHSKISRVREFDRPAFEFLGRLVKRKSIKTIGINRSSVALNEFSAMKKNFGRKKYADIGRMLLEQRKTKEKDEIMKIKRACSIADRIFAGIIRNFSFRTEEDILKYIEQQAMEHGCRLSFPSIVASGKNASMPHYRGKNVKLKKGFCVIDFGIEYKGYMSDMTRTIYIGRPSKHESWLYSILLRVQKRAIESARPGMSVSELVRIVKKALGRYEKNFIHALGHGIGVQIHELPSISEASKEKLGENDVFTIEPGIYFPGKLGIRIEDDILMTKKGPVVLSRSKKSLVAVKG